MTVLDPPPATTSPSAQPRLWPEAPWTDLHDVTPADGRVLAVVVASGVGVDVAMRSGLAGLAMALLGAVVAGGVLGTGRVTNRRAWPLLVLVPLFTSWVAVRDAEWLLALDLLVACALLVVGCSLARDGDAFDLTVPGLAGRGLHGTLHALFSWGFVARAFRGGRDDGEPARLVAVARGVVLAAPVVGMIALLLASADPVFASLFRFPSGAGDLVLHVVLVVIGGTGAAALLRMASGQPYVVEPLERAWLGRLEAATVLAALAVVFAAFTASQLATVIGGANYVRRTAGLSYADYARSGFFQLLAAAALTLALLLVLRAAVAVVDRRFVLLAEVSVVLTLVVVAGAVRRLWLYEQAYGLTVLRLFSVVFALWIGIVFVLLGLSLAGVGRRRAWLVPGAVAAAFAIILVMDVANPEAVIVRRNVDRFAGTERLDVRYLTQLSDDAVPALADALPGLPPEQADVVRHDVCTGDRTTTGGLWAFNAARASAVEARDRVCP